MKAQFLLSVAVLAATACQSAGGSEAKLTVKQLAEATILSLLCGGIKLNDVVLDPALKDAGMSRDDFKLGGKHRNELHVEMNAADEALIEYVPWVSLVHMAVGCDLGLRRYGPDGQVFRGLLKEK